MKVLVSGGGTGGHIYPALAVATQLRQAYEAEILYLGSDDGLETELAPAAGFALATVQAGKLRRYVSWKTLTGVMRVPVGMAQAVGIVRRFRPQVTFTTGGYVAVPAALAARLNSVPLLMHQQDVPPNLSNKMIAPLATRVSVAFADSLQYFPAAKTLHLGNPVRQAIVDVRQASQQEARKALGLEMDLPLLLVTGGSQGARHLNTTVCHTLPELLEHCQVLQISGKGLFEETCNLSESTLSGVDGEVKRRYRLEAYMDAEMPMALQAADLVLCRAGAATLSELAVLGKASLLVPLPPAIGNSPQEANAAMFGRKKAAEVLRDADLSPQVLIERLLALMSSRERLQEMADAALTLAKPQATQEIAAVVAQIAKDRKL